MYALDTNTVIYFFKNSGHVAEHLFSLPPHEIALPAVVLYELEVGIAKSTAPEKRRAQLNELLTVVRVLPFSGNIGKGESHTGTGRNADRAIRYDDCRYRFSQSSNLGNP